MAKAYLAVRAEVPAEERERFDQWYETDHLPWALRVFAARRAWRCWSRSDSGVHVAFYEFEFGRRGGSGHRSGYDRAAGG